MAVYKRGRLWWYRFVWNGESIRESTKQSNKRTAEQIEAAHKTSLAKGEVGIRDRKPAATIRQFATSDFLPFCRSTFAAKTKTLSMFALATEWGKVARALPRVRMLPGEAHRDRVVSVKEEQAYFEGTQAIGDAAMEAYQRALVGIRATERAETPIKPRDPFLLRDVAIMLIDCGIRPEECFRLRWENHQNDVIEITYGKTDNARRRIPLSQRAQSILEMRRAHVAGSWIFPAPTKSGHIEPSSLQGQHAKACTVAKVEHFPLYTFRHTCLTRWAPFMDPWTLAYLAGHRDMSITKRYVHPQEYNTRAAIEKTRVALGGHNSGHSLISTAHEPISNLAVSG